MTTLETPQITKSARVYRDLRRDITSGVHSPGQHLVRRHLVQKYG